MEIEKVGLPSSPTSLEPTGPVHRPPLNQPSSIESPSIPGTLWAFFLYIYQQCLELYRYFFSPAPPTPALVIAIEPKKETVAGYASFEPSDADKSDIRSVLHILSANTSTPWNLLFNNELDEKGKKIRHVHPFKFLKELLTTDLKNDLVKVQEAWIQTIWNSFIENLEASFNKQPHDHLLAYLPEFAAEVERDPATLRSSVEKKEWGKLLIELLKPQQVNHN